MIAEPPRTPRPPGQPADRQQPDYSLASLVRAFRFAFAGIWHLVRTQRNAQIHLLIGAIALALGWALGIARWEWVALVLTIALVLAAEGANTAIEAAVDVAMPEPHPLARIAKDVAAGTVLISAIAAVAVGCLVFVPHLWQRIWQLLAV